jgi:hypothetical protein
LGEVAKLAIDGSGNMDAFELPPRRFSESP